MTPRRPAGKDYASQLTFDISILRVHLFPQVVALDQEVGGGYILLRYGMDALRDADHRRHVEARNISIGQLWTCKVSISTSLEER